MADTDQLGIVRLSEGDAFAGLALSAEAQWNQNEADWRFFLMQGIALGVRDNDGHLIATAALLPYASRNAWISMVLVTARWRRQGVATKLVDACLDAAAKQGLTAWLDATPAGATVYGALGFAPTLQLRRLRLANSVRPKAAGVSLELACDLQEFIGRDHRAMGFRREALLAALSQRSGSRLWSNGYAMALVREGRKARHIGPLFADNSDRALALVHEIVRSESGPLLIDAVNARDDFLKSLTGSGWVVERPFQRMRFGGAPATAAEPPFAVAGPEFG